MARAIESGTVSPENWKSNHCPIMMVHASVASSKSKVELDSHAGMYAVGDYCLVIHDNNRPANVYSYNPKDGHRSANTVKAALG